MDILFLGTGSGLSTDSEQLQSNMVISTNNGKRLLVDCGMDIRFSLNKASLKPESIDGVYISHLHPDHVGGLAWLALYRTFMTNLPKLDLLIHPRVLKLLWPSVLKGQMDTIKDKKVEPETFFNVILLTDKAYSAWDSLFIRLVETNHMYHSKGKLPSFGLFFYEKIARCFLTTDTLIDHNRFFPLYEEANLIFHDCELFEPESGVHAHFNALCQLPSHYKRKMWLYHYGQHLIKKNFVDEFLGFIKDGQLFRMPD
jgi:ribonuclease BN (tRNA processing enzyme)